MRKPLQQLQPSGEKVRDLFRSSAPLMRDRMDRKELEQLYEEVMDALFGHKERKLFDD